MTEPIDQLMVSGSASDDLTESLEAASRIVAGMMSTQAGQFAICQHAGVGEYTISLADQFVAWLRKIKSVTFIRIVEEIDTGEVVSTSEGGAGMTNIDTSQRVRYVLTGKDDRGFEVDGDLQGRLGTDGVVTLVVTQATEGTASGKDEAVATFAGLGTTSVEFFDSANPAVVLAVDTIVANPGGIASVELVATVEEIPAPEPPPVP